LVVDLYTHSGAGQEWFERRTFSHGGYGAHGYLVFNNDDGVFIYTPHVPTKMVEIEKQEDMEIIFRAFKEGITRIGEPIRGGVDAPFNRVEFMGRQSFQPGQVQFFPACDTVINLLHTLSNLLNNSDPKQRTPPIDELNGKLMCAQHWVDDGYLQGIPMPWAWLELKIISGGGELAAMMMQNIDLVAAAMGLGAYKYTNVLMPVLLGGTPAMRGIGFRFSSDKKGFMYPVGIDGQFSAHAPPALSLDDAADTYYRLCWGPEGRSRPWVKEGDEVLDPAFSPKPRAVHRPFKDSEGFLKVLSSYPEEMPGCGPYTPESRQIIREIFHYLYDTYGRVPRTAEPMWLPFVVQVQHLAVDFYDKYFKEGVISQEQREHLKVWHGLDEE
jgi:hypothetical protein